MRKALLIVAACAALTALSGAAVADDLPCCVLKRPLRAEGISPPLKRPLIQQLACQQKLCPGPKKPLVQLAEDDWQHMKRPLLAEGIRPCPVPLKLKLLA